jgi:hypothetical protein
LSCEAVSALEKYIKTKGREREEEKRKKMQRASRKMGALAKKLGNWNPQATIRKFRDTNLKQACDYHTLRSLRGASETNWLSANRSG